MFSYIVETRRRRGRGGTVGGGEGNVPMILLSAVRVKDTACAATTLFTNYGTDRFCCHLLLYLHNTGDNSYKTLS